MNDPENIVAAIYRAVDWINAELPDRQLIKAPETRLVGSQSVLDSMHLVSLIVAIEQEVEDTFDVALTLANEQALSMKASPFRSIQSLADYIGTLIIESRLDSRPQWLRTGRLDHGDAEGHRPRLGRALRWQGRPRSGVQPVPV